MQVEILVLAAQAPQVPPAPLWERFLLSPGFGGVAALIGGVLAYVVARRKAEYDREAARQKQWWDALAWVYDRSTAERPEARLSEDLAMDLVTRLRREAQTDLELQTIAGLLEEFFQDETEEEDDD